MYTTKHNGSSYSWSSYLNNHRSHDNYNNCTLSDVNNTWNTGNYTYKDINDHHPNDNNSLPVHHDILDSSPPKHRPQHHFGSDVHVSDLFSQPSSSPLTEEMEDIRRMMDLSDSRRRRRRQRREHGRGRRQYRGYRGNRTSKGTRLTNNVMNTPEEQYQGTAEQRIRWEKMERNLRVGKRLQQLEQYSKRIVECKTRVNKQIRQFSALKLLQDDITKPVPRATWERMRGERSYQCAPSKTMVEENKTTDKDTIKTNSKEPRVWNITTNMDRTRHTATRKTRRLITRLADRISSEMLSSPSKTDGTDSEMKIGMEDWLRHLYHLGSIDLETEMEEILKSMRDAIDSTLKKEKEVETSSKIDSESIVEKSRKRLIQRRKNEARKEAEQRVISEHRSMLQTLRKASESTNIADIEEMGRIPPQKYGTVEVGRNLSHREEELQRELEYTQQQIDSASQSFEQEKNQLKSQHDALTETKNRLLSSLEEKGYVPRGSELDIDYTVDLNEDISDLSLDELQKKECELKNRVEDLKNSLDSIRKERKDKHEELSLLKEDLRQYQEKHSSTSEKYSEMKKRLASYSNQNEDWKETNKKLSKQAKQLRKKLSIKQQPRKEVEKELMPEFTDLISKNLAAEDILERTEFFDEEGVFYFQQLRSILSEHMDKLRTQKVEWEREVKQIEHRLQHKKAQVVRKKALTSQIRAKERDVAGDIEQEVASTRSEFQTTEQQRSQEFGELMATINKNEWVSDILMNAKIFWSVHPVTRLDAEEHQGEESNHKELITEIFDDLAQEEFLLKRYLKLEHQIKSTCREKMVSKT
eukprot:gb/GECH01001685.1/.p1 GENE.gb/GECH01001685.1/~~gb/GECH01001685.1/.p1  ORF type:complete len:813 (+),score=160.53 gb/GECH01001685.1/:1-2439(+)